jgi:hypothetical protein
VLEIQDMHQAKESDPKGLLIRIPVRELLALAVLSRRPDCFVRSTSLEHDDALLTKRPRPPAPVQPVFKKEVSRASHRQLCV